MQYDFNGKVAVITGGANGIGLATTRLLSQAKADVWVIDMEQEGPLERAAEVGARGAPADGTNRAPVEPAFDQAGDDLDIVVACAGIVSTASPAETKPADWEKI